MAWWRVWPWRRAARGAGDTSNVFSGGTVTVLVQGRDITVRLPHDVPSALRGMPRAPTVFTGRADELTAIATRLAPVGPAAEGRSVSVVTGMAGVGKTVLVRQVAHDLAAANWFTGGVLYVRLHGYDPLARLDADGAALEMLGMLGVPPEAVPAGLQARCAMVRTVLAGMADAGHRVLIVLDDVSASAQVEPVLPNVAAHPVLITSRHTLTALDEAGFDLGVLRERTAVDLLAAAVHHALPHDARLRHADRHARQLARLCGGLPLARVHHGNRRRTHRSGLPRCRTGPRRTRPRPPR